VLATVTSEPHDKLLEDLSGSTFFGPEFRFLRAPRVL
jgi:hypothetical protein